MKKYSKPIIGATQVVDISEPVYMTWSSGTAWLGSPCYVGEILERQDPSPGARMDYRFQANLWHLASDPEYISAGGSDPEHHNHGQYIIIAFDGIIPSNIAVKVYGNVAGTEFNGKPMETIELGGKSYARIFHNYHQNGEDKIGLGNFIISLEGLTSAQQADSAVINAIYPRDITCFDEMWRHDKQHANWP